MISRRGLLSGAAAFTAWAIVPKPAAAQIPRTLGNTGPVFFGIDPGAEDIQAIFRFAGPHRFLDIYIDGVWQRLGKTKCGDLVDGEVYDLGLNLDSDPSGQMRITETSISEPTRLGAFLDT